MPDFETAFLGSTAIAYQRHVLRRTDSLFLSPVSHLLIKRHYTNSPRLQGIALATEGTITIQGKESKGLRPQDSHGKILLWEDTAPPDLHLLVRSRDQFLKVDHVWVEEGRITAWQGGAALLVHYTSYGACYFCNDGAPDENFDDLVFEIAITPEPSIHLRPCSFQIDQARSPVTRQETLGIYTACDFTEGARKSAQLIRQGKRSYALGQKNWRGYVDPFASEGKTV
ncbi:MAG: hypothetical protein AB7M93_25875 [Candidatus Obscuribacterales bacterium]